MLKYRPMLSSVVAALGVVAAFSVQASTTVSLSGFTLDPRGNPANPFTDIAGNNITTIAVGGAAPVPPPAGLYSGGGQMMGSYNAASFLAYCVQISVPVLFGPTYTDYVEVSGPVGFGDRATHLASLLTWAQGAGLTDAAGVPSSAAHSAALQAAVWEVVHESSAGAYSFTAGKLATSSNSAATQASLNTIDTNWATIMATVPTATVARLDGAAQDLLIFAPVPEVPGAVLMSLGLAGLGAVVRRRRVKAV